MRLHHRISALLLSASCLVACGSNGSDGDEGNAGSTSGGTGGSTANGGSGGAAIMANFLGCPSDALFHLFGDVDGTEIDINEAPTTGGFSQQSNPPGPNFRIPNATAEDDEQLVVVYMTWDHVVANGEVAPVIEGFARLPLGGPLPGETICAGPGSEMTIPTDADEATQGEFQFRFDELSGGADCSEPRSGHLHGCWRN